MNFWSSKIRYISAIKVYVYCIKVLVTELEYVNYYLQKWRLFFIFKARTFHWVTLSENCLPLGRDNVHWQIFEYIFTPNGGYILYLTLRIILQIYFTTRATHSFENWGISRGYSPVLAQGHIQSHNVLMTNCAQVKIFDGLQCLMWLGDKVPVSQISTLYCCSTNPLSSVEDGFGKMRQTHWKLSGTEEQNFSNMSISHQV